MTDLSTRAEDGEGTLNSLSLFGGRGAAKVIEADLEPLVRFGVELVVWVRERVGQLVPSCATGIKRDGHLSQSACAETPSFAAMTSVVVPYSSVPQIWKGGELV